MNTGKKQTCALQRKTLQTRSAVSMQCLMKAHWQLKLRQSTSSHMCPADHAPTVFTPGATRQCAVLQCGRNEVECSRKQQKGERTLIASQTTKPFDRYCCRVQITRQLGHNKQLHSRRTVHAAMATTKLVHNKALHLLKAEQCIHPT